MLFVSLELIGKDSRLRGQSQDVVREKEHDRRHLSAKGQTDICLPRALVKA